MTYFVKTGNSFLPSPVRPVLDVHDQLPAGNYVIKQDAVGNMFLETVDGFSFPPKRYGDNPRHTCRILDTFYARRQATGVMLTGEKGSGKSLLAKTISLEGAKRGTPTILINAPWCGDQFNLFIQSIDQPAIILFDEFEKVYDQAQQEQILTLLDGVFPTQKLFVFTCNDKYRIDANMRNRPGRIYYMLDFTGLDVNFIEEYCKDNLLYRDHIQTICKLSKLFTHFNFDMLKALVEELNRYGESPADALRMLNVRPEFDEGKPVFTATLTQTDGTVVKHTSPKEWSGNPLSFGHSDEDEDDSALSIAYRANIADKTPAIELEAKGTHWVYLNFKGADLSNAHDGVYTFKTEGFVLTLARKSAKAKKSWLDSL